jgi:NADPH:quinone reductase-like Zn-dependent oxidoreductase
MNAVIHRHYGAPSRALVFEDVDKPTPADDEVLVHVRAVGLNSIDWRLVRARPAMVRLTHGLRRPGVTRFGRDAAGIVEAVGANVTELKSGDEVFGTRTGSLAEYVCGTEFVRKPAALGFDEAAALGIAGVTALQALRDKGNVKVGSRVAINGAGGGVGSFAVQIAKQLGAHVTAVTSADKQELARRSGADVVLDYAREDFTAAGTYDAIIDCAGDRSFGRELRALNAGGVIVVVGAHKKLLRRVIAGNVRRRVRGQPIVFFVAAVDRDDLRTLASMAESGQLRPHIDRTFPFNQTAEAIEYIEQERVAGKVVITMPA